MKINVVSFGNFFLETRSIIFLQNKFVSLQQAMLQVWSSTNFGNNVHNDYL